VPQRHADFITWQPPEEENDDEPIFGDGPTTRVDREPHEHGASEERRAAEGSGTEAQARSLDGDFAEVYINIGRRDGARASDFQRVLTDRGGMERADVRRIRVRERNAFVSVRRTELAKAISALSGATIAGRPVTAEQARDRAGEGGAELSEGGVPTSQAGAELGVADEAMGAGGRKAGSMTDDAVLAQVKAEGPLPSTPSTSMSASAHSKASSDDDEPSTT